jgi:peptidoglycan/LPS O-acetylase OafA/YrhL
LIPAITIVHLCILAVTCYHIYRNPALHSPKARLFWIVVVLWLAVVGYLLYWTCRERVQGWATRYYTWCLKRKEQRDA